MTNVVLDIVNAFLAGFSIFPCLVENVFQLQNVFSNIKEIMLASLFGVPVWAITIGLVSYFAGDFGLQIYEKIKNYPWLTPLVLGVIIALIVIYFKFATKRVCNS